MAAEIGALGLGAFLALMGVLFYSSVKILPKINYDFTGAVLNGSMAGLIGFLVQSFFDTSFYSVQLSNLMWLFMGLIIAARSLSLAKVRNN